MHGLAVAPEAAASPAPVPTIVGYELLREIGAGGSGSVHEAIRSSDGVRLAIKVAAHEAMASERLEREAEALATIGPPYVPAFFELGHASDGRRFLAMELVTAPTLGEIMGRGPTSLGRLAEIGPAILRAVAAAHAKGYTHRDLKPENIFIDGTRARLIDFGLVKRSDLAVDPGLTRAGELVGTAEYMAPEQCSVGTAIDHRADIYAIGVILYELLVGKPPFWGSSSDVQQGHRRMRPPRPSEHAAVPLAVEEIVLRCLAKEPERRFDSAGAVLAALEAALAATSPSAAPTRSDAPAARPASTRSKRTVALLLLPISDVGAVQAILAGNGGTIGHVSAAGTIGVFDADAGAVPPERALQAARECLAQGICQRALIDVASAVVEIRPDGSRRYACKGFETLTLGEAVGVQATAAARILLGDALREVDAGSAAPFLGRDQLLARIEDLARAAIEGPTPTVACVLADAGYGKSRFHQALAARLAAHMDVLALRATDAVDGKADDTFRDLLRRALGVEATTPDDRGRRGLQEILGPDLGVQLWPGVALALGWIEADAPELRRLGAAPGVLRQAAARAAGEALRRRARRRPLAVLLDDAHFADETSLDALEHAALAEAAVPIFVSVSSRPRFAETRPSWGERAARRETVVLGPLERDAAGRCAASCSCQPRMCRRGAVEMLLARSQSIPLILVELVRALRRDGLVRQRERGGRWYVASEQLDQVPDLPLVEWLTQRELDGLPAELRAHAQLASLLGAEVATADVEGVVAQLERRGATEFPLDAAVGLRQLAATGIMVERERGHYGFRHALVRDAVARTVAASQRASVHRAASAYYQTASVSDTVRLPNLAYHAAQAGVRDLARDTYFQLAERAAARQVYLDAEMLYSRCIEHLVHKDADVVAGRAFRGRGRMRYRLGRYDDAIADLSRARQLTTADRAEEIMILLDEATALDWMGDFSSSKARVEEAERAAGLLAGVGGELQAALFLARGRSCLRFPPDDTAAGLLWKAIAAAADLGDDGYEILIIAYLLLGGMLPFLNRLDEADAALDRAIRASAEHEDRLHLAAAFNNRGLARGFRGDGESVIADYGRVLELARELGQPTMELMATFNLAEFHYFVGQLDAGITHVERAVALERRLVGEWGRPLSVILEARLRLARGETARAGEVVGWIRRQQEGARAHGREDAMLVPAEDVLCCAVELALADADADSWARLGDRCAKLSVGQDQIELLAIRARAARGKGRMAEAARLFGEALELCQHIPTLLRQGLECEAAGLQGVAARPRPKSEPRA